MTKEEISKLSNEEQTNIMISWNQQGMTPKQLSEYFPWTDQVILDYLLQHKLYYKQCYDCKQIFYMNNYQRDSKKDDKLDHRCKPCKQKYRRQVGVKNKKIREHKSKIKLMSLEEKTTYMVELNRQDGLSAFELSKLFPWDDKTILNWLIDHDLYHKICSKDDCKYVGIPQHMNKFYKQSNNSDSISPVCITCRRSLYRDYEKQYRVSYAKYSSYGVQLEKYEKVTQLENDEFTVRCSLDTCQKEFQPTTTECSKRIMAINGKAGSIGTENRFYCSEQCKHDCVRYGKQAGQLIMSDMIMAGHVNIDNMDREVQPELKEMCFERDNHTCQKCGKTRNEIELHCHHIEGIHWAPLESADLDMTITYCKDCHYEVHKIPGCTQVDMRCNAEDILENIALAELK